MKLKQYPLITQLIVLTIFLLWRPGKIETYENEMDEKSLFQKTIENPNFEYQKVI